ncbi:tyrosinase 2 [Chlorella sorokiniana]|uniref:Tyrosinase 2 n=1 Tax=Chlorella sorokiniana TaxID=3076 RepID=A0A2P6U1K7_CHLSO|nr:tyrosinase 2 [Chlorella sorokiniana]|eukprot:PRW60197.1 tyrosinase 2 [Chlorella sorokiniana]
MASSRPSAAAQRTALLCLLLCLGSFVTDVAAQAQTRRVSGGSSGSWQRGRPRRVRKELRSLSPREYKMYLQGVSTMLTVPTAAGQKIFGSKYKDYATIVIRHAVAVPDMRGDQGHYVPCFMTFHCAVMLEFENALLSVVPELSAMPYWNFLLDAPGGKYYKTDRWAFGDLYGGSMVGDPDVGYAVTDGVFGWRQITRYSAKRFAEYQQFYSGSPKGFVRGLKSTVDNPYIVRFPANELAPAVNSGGETSSGLDFSSLKLSPRLIPTFYNAATNNTLPAWLKQDYENCLTAHISDWAKWAWCVDVDFALNAVNVTEASQYLPGASPLMHGMTHALIGGLLAKKNQFGDMADIITSPNDVAFFMPMHANLDRSNMMFQANSQYRNSSMARDDVMWNYPKSQAEYAKCPIGCRLHDVINSNAKFTDIFDPPKSTGFTHFDVLDRTRPDTADYTYDEVWGALPLYIRGYTNRPGAPQNGGQRPGGRQPGGK